MNKTKSQQAQEYVLNRQTARHNAKPDEDATMRDFDKTIKAWDVYDMEQAFEDGYIACEQSLWRSVEEELPEEKKVVLCFMPDMKDNYAENDSYFDMAILLEGEFINLDAETIHPTHWMQIPIPSLPDTNTENP